MKLKNYIMADNGEYLEDRVESLNDLPEEEKKEYEKWSEEVDESE